MSKSVPVYLLILVSIFAFGLGLVVSPYVGFGISSMPIPPDDDTISVTVPPGQPEMMCNWCGGECVELGSRTQCADLPVDPNLWCGPQDVDGQQVCQATAKPDITHCDAINACDSDEGCYSYPELSISKCVGHDEKPGKFCPSGQGEVSPEAIYPPRVVCK